MKTCVKCKIEKNLSEFAKDKYNPDGLTYRCKECRNKHYNEYYKNNPDKQKIKNDSQKENRKKYYSSEEGIKSSRRSHLKRAFGISLEEYEKDYYMKTLNLVDESKSDIKYQIQRFPDGQQNIVLDFNIFKDIRANNKIQGYSHQVEIHRNYEVKIKSRLNNWSDLELIVCAVASLKECQVPIIHLYTPYIIGARSDRKFEEGGNNYLKDVICPIINSLNFKSVTCIDSHSDVLEACIKGFRKESNLDLVEFSLDTIYNNNGWNGKWQNNCILVSPDAGATKKIYKLAEQIGYKGDIITCSKDRDKNGKLTRTVVPITNIDYFKKDMIIIDDICDGGATFINIANEIKKDCKSTKIYLIVTHGIFSKSTTKLSHYFDKIYCTNSYRDLDGVESLLVKQLNVF